MEKEMSNKPITITNKDVDNLRRIVKAIDILERGEVY